MLGVFDIFKIGIGPSSSHTVGPMRAARAFAQLLQSRYLIQNVTRIHTELFGSLGQTGRGHGSGKAIILGLLGEEPETVNVDMIEQVLTQIETSEQLHLLGQQLIDFPTRGAIQFHRRKTLPLHANGMTLTAWHRDQLLLSETYYSIGGGFVLTAQELQERQHCLAPPNNSLLFDSATSLITQCVQRGWSISRLMRETETLKGQTLDDALWEIWQVMRQCIQRGIQTEGVLQGGLRLPRRAPGLHRQLQADKSQDSLLTMDWVNLFALAVNEENAAGGRVVTAPTNGAAGIIPAVMCYYNQFIQPLNKAQVSRFLLTAAAIGILYKLNASISGAEVGCQGEVGVACSMAAAGLCELLGGHLSHVENAAEIGMEHNLGLTCDPVGGLVQVPCIERNAMGAIKAINAARLAIRGTGEHKVSLDKVIKTMRDTGRDMKTKYKETARGGLAVNIIEC